jgi:CheY-like chemotaxis protein
LRLRITKNPAVASIDGVNVWRYRAGLVYDVPTAIANVFLAEGWAQPADEQEPALFLPPRDHRAVLVAEDDADMRTITIEMLSIRGFPAFAAKNGREALALLRERRPGLVLLDLMMPVMDGWTFRREQLADPEISSIPVILLTAVSNAQEHGRTLGAVDVLEKPIENFEVLVDTVRRRLQN